MNVRIRLATITDVSTLEELDREVVAYHHALDASIWAAAHEYPEEYFKNFWTDVVRSNDARVLLLLIEDQPVGFFLARTEESSASMRFVKRGVVDRVYVREQYRGKGLARVGLDAATEWFKERKVAFIDLHVEARNELGISVWKKLGFEPYVIEMKKEVR